MGRPSQKARLTYLRRILGKASYESIWRYSSVIHRERRKTEVLWSERRKPEADARHVRWLHSHWRPRLFTNFNESRRWSHWTSGYSSLARTSTKECQRCVVQKWNEPIKLLDVIRPVDDVVVPWDRAAPGLYQENLKTGHPFSPSISCPKLTRWRNGHWMTSTILEEAVHPSYWFGLIKFHSADFSVSLCPSPSFCLSCHLISSRLTKWSWPFISLLVAPFSVMPKESLPQNPSTLCPVINQFNF